MYYHIFRLFLVASENKGKKYRLHQMMGRIIRLSPDGTGGQRILIKILTYGPSFYGEKYLTANRLHGRRITRSLTLGQWFLNYVYHISVNII